MAIFAQDQPQQLRTEATAAPRFGLKGGVNLATLEMDDDVANTNYNTNLKTSFNVGAFVNLPVGTGMFRLQPEVVYSGQGSKVSGTPVIGSRTSTDDYEVDIHYINVPIMAQIQTTGGFFVEAGPQFGVMISAKQDNQTGDDPEIQDYVKKLDIGLGAGLGYLSRIGLGVGARYVHGFSNVWNREDAPASAVSSLEMSNRVIQFSLIYQFGANK